MRMMSTLMCKQVVPLLKIPVSSINMESVFPPRPKERLIFVMGATGTGKSRLSIDLATHFPAEIINSDKIQVHKGLDIVTNKVTKEEQCGIPHHLLGIVNPNADFTAKDFVHMASHAVDSILSRHKIPIIVGGSNSYIEALVDAVHQTDRHDRSLCSKYDCCFLWVDVSMPVLHQFLSHRVDRMAEAGMVDEVRMLNLQPVDADAAADYSRGIWKAIGVPELDRYLQAEPFLDQKDRARLLSEAMDQVKENTWKLACRQLGKIHRLRNVRGWNLHRLDATPVFQRHIMWSTTAGANDDDEAWHKLVTRPSMKIVSQFLDTSPSTAFSSRTSGLAAMSVARSEIITAP